MQLGMVGLGRMGAGLVRRLMRDGHDCVGYDVSADAVKALEADGADGATSLQDFAAKLEPPRMAWVMVPAGEITDKTIAGARRGARAGGHDHRRRQHLLPRRHPSRRRARRRRASTTSTVGTSGGVWGLERGFCLMIGGEDGGRRAAQPDLRLDRPGVDAAPRTPGRTGEPSAGRAGLLPLRSERRRPLREDGPQRHRVRAHGRLRRGAEHPPERRRRQAPAGHGRRDGAARAPRVLPVRHRHHRGRRGVAARERHRVVAARSDRRGAPGLADARRVHRPRVGLRRGALDLEGCDR